LSISKDEGGNVQEYSNNVNSSEQTGIHHQLFQKQADTREGTGFLRFPIQHEDNDYLGSYHDGETNKSGQAIVEVTNEEVMLLVTSISTK
jgi:hypothetical protein